MFSQSKRLYESEADRDDESIKSESVRLPPPEGLDRTTGFEVAPEDLTGAWGDVDEPDSSYLEPSVSSEVRSEKTQELDPVSERNLRSMIGDSCLGVQPTVKFKFLGNVPGYPRLFKEGKSC